MKWILCDERLPKEGQMVLTTIRGHDVIILKEGETLEEAMERIWNEVCYVSVGFIGSDGWYGADGYPLIVHPIAWMPLPKPYTADRKTEPTSSKMEQVDEPKICDACRYYNSNIPCGSTPSACKEADKFAEEFVDGLKKLKQTVPTISKMEQVDKDINVRSKDEPKTQMKTQNSNLTFEKADEPQTNADQHVQHIGSVESVEPTWTTEEHEAFYTFLWNVINPNEMQEYIGMFETKDEPQTDCAWK